MLSCWIVPTVLRVLSCQIMPGVKVALDDTMLQVVTSCKRETMPSHLVLKKLYLVRHAVPGDGSCLYHAVEHQAGFITKTSCGDKVISNNLRHN